MDDLYDEFGNYIGPDADSDEDAGMNDVEDRPDTPLVSPCPTRLPVAPSQDALLG